MSFQKIVNPETGRKVSINGKLGKKILSNYLYILRGGTSVCVNYHDDPVKCQSSRDKTGKYCVYSAAKVKGEIGQCRKSTAKDVEKSKESSRRRASLEKKFQESAAVRVQKRYRSKKKLDRLADSAKDILTRSRNKKSIAMAAQIGEDLRKSKARKSGKNKFKKVTNTIYTKRGFEEAGIKNKQKKNKQKKNKQKNKSKLGPRPTSPPTPSPCMKYRRGKCREAKGCMLTKGKKKKCVPCDFDKYNTKDHCIYR